MDLWTNLNVVDVDHSNFPCLVDGDTTDGDRVTNRQKSLGHHLAGQAGNYLKLSLKQAVQDSGCVASKYTRNDMAKSISQNNGILGTLN